MKPNEGSASRLLAAAAIVLGAMLSAQTVVANSTVSNSLFSISLPADLVAETDGKGTIAASGPEGEAGFPFLFIFFCALEAESDGVKPCDSSWHPLNVDDIRELVSKDWKGEIRTRDRGSNVTEWGACVESPFGATCIRRLRSKTGYIDLRYLREDSKIDLEQSIDALVATIKWQ